MWNESRTEWNKFNYPELGDNRYPFTENSKSFKPAANSKFVWNNSTGLKFLTLLWFGLNYYATFNYGKTQNMFE